MRMCKSSPPPPTHPPPPHTHHPTTHTHTTPRSSQMFYDKTAVIDYIGDLLGCECLSMNFHAQRCDVASLPAGPRVHASWCCRCCALLCCAAVGRVPASIHIAPNAIS